MKRKRLYIFGGILATLLVGGLLVYYNFFGVMNTLRDARLDMAGFDAGTIKTDSTQIYYRKGGTGKKTVLLVHGFGLGGATTWFDTMLEMDEELTFIVPDLLWFGESTGNIAPNLPNQARTMWELCDSLHIKPDAIVGISYGGFVAFEMLHQRPQGAKELLVINSPGPVFQKDDIADLCKRAEVNSPDELFIPNDVAGLHHLFNFVFSEEPPIPGFIYGQIFENETQRNADIKRNLMKDLVNNADIYRAAGFPKHTKNSVIWGQNDQVFPLVCGQELADSLDAEIVILEKSGHIPNPKERDIYMAALRKVLVD